MATERVDVGSLRLERPAASPLHLGKTPLDIFFLRTVFPKGKFHENKGQAPTVLKKQTAQLHRERRQSPSGTDRNEGKMEGRRCWDRPLSPAPALPASHGSIQPYVSAYSEAIHFWALCISPWEGRQSRVSEHGGWEKTELDLVSRQPARFWDSHESI